MKNFLKVIKGFIVFFIFIFASCTEDEQIVTSLTFDSETFYANKAKWEECKPFDYKFSYEIDCGYEGLTITVISTVKNGEWKSFEYKANNDSVQYDSFSDRAKHSLDKFCLKTIDDYINYLEEKYKSLISIDFEKEQLILYELNVFYNEEYFFPNDYEIIKLEKNTPEPFDGGGVGVCFGGKILDFQVLPSDQVIE